MRISDWSSDVCSSDLVRDVEEIRAEHATVRSVLAIDDQIDRAAVLANADIRMRGGQCCQRGLDGATGGIGGMHDAAMAVTAFTRQMQVRACRRCHRSRRRSEEHTSELQSLMRNSYAVFCLKKKKRQ